MTANRLGGLVLGLLLPPWLPSCGLGGRIDLYDRARKIALEVAAQSRGILPHDTGEADVSTTYTGDSIIPAATGGATLTGTYTYDHAYYTVNTTTRTRERVWDYDSVHLSGLPERGPRPTAPPP